MTATLKPGIRSLKPGARTILISGFRFLTAVFLISVFSLLAFAPAAQAACSSPAGSAGNIINNSDYHVPQYCDGTNWIAMGQPGGTSLGFSRVAYDGTRGTMRVWGDGTYIYFNDW